MKKIPALEARRRLGTLLDEVRLRGAEYVIERDGRPVAAVIPLETYERLKQRRDDAFDRVQEIRDRLSQSLSAEEIESLIDSDG